MGKKSAKSTMDKSVKTKAVQGNKGSAAKARIKKKPAKKSKDRLTKPKVEAQNKSSDEDVLRAEVFALGGDEDDLKLIEGLDGPAVKEEEEEDFSEKARRELEEFVKKLGLDKKFVSSAEAVDADGDEDEEEEEESDDDVVEFPSKDEIKEEPEDKEEVEAPAKPSKTSKKESGGFHFVKEKPERRHCLVKTSEGSSSKWHQLVPFEEGGEGATPTSDYWLAKLEKHASALLEQECENHQKLARKGGSSSQRGYIDAVLKSGALGDRVSAQAVLLQESPVHSLRALDALVGLVSLKSRRPCMMAMAALKDVFVGRLLAEDRRLRPFRECPFHKLDGLSSGNKDVRDRYLLLWWFEDRLKEAYGRFLAALDEVAKDTIEKTKVTVMSVFLELLMSNPERESELLSRIVNKLGDPSRAVASKAVHQLKTLLGEHSAMKEVVVKEVERLLYRPNIGKKAQYYGVCFLSQVLLEADESALANRLIGIYFGYFKANVKKGEIDSKLMSALLTGVNRAFPYATIARENLESHVQVVFKLVHMLENFNTSVQCLTLLYQIMDCGESATDRYYMALYKTVADPRLSCSTSKITVLLNLLFKSLKKDPLLPRVKAFVKRLLQVCMSLPSETTCGILFLISEVLRVRKDVPESGGVVALLSPAAGEQVLAKLEEDDEDEHYDDVVEEEDEAVSETKAKTEKDSKSKGSWVHKKNLGKGGSRHGAYCPFQRNPTYCGAERASAWELSCLASHAHPTVALFAGNLLRGAPIKYDGDPLQDFTLMRFLDRFVFRNPKKDPLKGRPDSVHSRRRQYVPGGVKRLAPDSKEYASVAESAVPADERFIFRYFAERRARRDALAGDHRLDDDDNASVTSEDFNSFMDGYFKQGGDGLDFAANVDSLKGDEEEEDGSEEEELEDGADSEEEEEPELEGEDDADFESLENLDSEGSDEFDEEGFGKSDESDEDEKQIMPSQKKRKRGKQFIGGAPLKKSKGGGLQDLLASAEEFADVVEEAAANDLDLGGAGAVSNAKDKAGKKQLKWESKRGGNSGGWKNKKKTQFGKRGKR